MISIRANDSSIGQAAGGLELIAERFERDQWREIGRHTADERGLVSLPVQESDSGSPAGIYRLTFDAESHFAKRGESCRFPQVVAVVEVFDGDRDVHVVLKLGRFDFAVNIGTR